MAGQICANAPVSVQACLSAVNDIVAADDELGWERTERALASAARWPTPAKGSPRSSRSGPPSGPGASGPGFGRPAPGPAAGAGSGLHGYRRPMTVGRQHVRPTARLAATVALLGTLGLTVLGPTPDSAGAQSPAAPAPTDPAALVHPVRRHRHRAVSPGTVGEFPGADLPFGMLQWSPDTSPNAVQAGGGYTDADSRINGFSLTHLSGTGCPSYQDVPILPTEGAIGSNPQATVADLLARAGARQSRSLRGQARTGVDRGRARRHDAFGHRTLHLSPGTQSNVSSRSPTARTPSPPARCASSATTKSRVRSPAAGSARRDAITRSTSSHVSTAPSRRPGAGPARVAAGNASCTGPSCGAYVRFDTTDPARGRNEGRHLLRQHPRRRAEPRPRGPRAGRLQRVSDRATAQWNALLGHVSRGEGRRPRSTPSTPRSTTRSCFRTSCRT